MKLIQGLFAPTHRVLERPARIVALGGDGIGPEVVDSAVRCLQALLLPIKIHTPAHGSETIQTHDTALPDEVRQLCLDADAILFGAVETASVEILRFLRFELACYANLRPAVTLKNVAAHSHRVQEADANLVIVRELTEGMYPGREGQLPEFHSHWSEFRDRLHRPLPQDGYFALRVITESASRRIGRYAAQLAAQRQASGIGMGKVTIVTKANILPQTDGLFLRCCEQEAQAIDGITVEHLYVDEAARQLVAQPTHFDVLVTSNLFGDILSDIATEVVSSLPLAPSAAIGTRHAYFEAVHGSAPDIAGKGIANPIGAILSAAMLLAYLGYEEAGQQLEWAIENALASGCCTPDLGGTASTEQLTTVICNELRR